ncbi:MAG: hypothetical protein U1D25_07455 [Hydrogenophaga sp.]|uniref:hypothetical protein n=1 Tax=Hydrogenophaga sp. TaxID=1904254 RepID=UPI00275C2658|nr:hypothetical protein [Hydrogenophaga sp.]MDP2418414.1 hypothetical protein [Hydrogenophaga sp.]MDZ4187925.1 hypothetical protein [Hydrogenophaga sp.]
MTARNPLPRCHPVLITVRWRPEGEAINGNYDRSFQGEGAAVLAEAVGYIERNYLTVTVIKHPDRAESTRFWNFALLDIHSALGRVVAGLNPESDTPVTVDIGYQSIVISSSGELPSIQVLAHPHARSPRAGR